MPSKHLILCRPLFLLPSIFPSIRIFSNESVLPIRWPKYWSFSFSISPSDEYLGLTSFRMDWLDLLAVQRTIKSLLQHHSSKASILWRSACFVVQLSHFIGQKRSNASSSVLRIDVHILLLLVISASMRVGLDFHGFVSRQVHTTATSRLATYCSHTQRHKTMIIYSCLKQSGTVTHSVMFNSLQLLWTVSRQAPLSMGSSRQEYWSGLLFPSPGDLPDPGMEPGSPTLCTDPSLPDPPGKPSYSALLTFS